jgi:hypothetical protein
VATATTSSSEKSFQKKRRKLPKCPEEERSPPPRPVTAQVSRQQSMLEGSARKVLEGSARERLEKMARNQMLRDKILQDQMAQSTTTTVQLSRRHSTAGARFTNV